jgi:hypothetical protein
MLSFADDRLEERAEGQRGAFRAALHAADAVG